MFLPKWARAHSLKELSTLVHGGQTLPVPCRELLHRFYDESPAGEDLGSNLPLDHDAD